MTTRILADVYLKELDYPNAIKVAESSLELLHRVESSNGRKLPRSAFSKFHSRVYKISLELE